MAKIRKERNYLMFRPDFSNGDLDHVVAERDDLLAHYYVGKERFVTRAASRDDQASIFVGPKGVGKSAILQMIRLDERSHGDAARLIEISPDDLAFNALVNIQHRTPILDHAAQNTWLFTSLWDYVLCVEILRREDSDRSGVGVFLEKVIGTKYEAERRRLLNLTLADDGTQSTMTDKMLALISAIEIEGGYDEGKGSMRLEMSNTHGSRKTEDLKLLQLINNVARQLPANLRHEYYILIDDLDLHWTGSELQNYFLGAMFLSIRKLSRSRNVKFVVAIRKNIYRQIHLDERDKFSDLVCEVTWTKDDVKKMVERRLAMILSVTENEVWTELFQPGFFELIWSHTDETPRAVIRLAVTAINTAIRNSHLRVDQSDMQEALREFSDDRISDLADLHRYAYPLLGLVIREFRGQTKEFPADVVQEVAFRIAEMARKNMTEPKLSWAIQGFEEPVLFARILVACGFLKVKEHRTAMARIASEDQLEKLSPQNWFAVHPTYVPALDLK